MITEEMVLQNIAGATQYILAQKKWTHEAMAEYLGVSVGQISKWRNGLQKPDILIICKMAELSGETIDTILTHNLYEEKTVKERDEQQRTIMAAISGNEGILRMMNLKTLITILISHIKELAKDSSTERALQLYEFGADLGDMECLRNAIRIVQKEIDEIESITGEAISMFDNEYSLIEKLEELQNLAQDLTSFDMDESLTSFYTKVHLKKFINPERLERHIKHMREEQIPALKATILSCKPENQSALPIMKGLYNNWVNGAYPPEEAKKLVFED